jgi:hypothetical protein
VRGQYDLQEIKGGFWIQKSPEGNVGTNGFGACAQRRD